MNNNHHTTPTAIYHIRKSAGLTQSQAAVLVGRKLRIWQHWEAGTREMPMEMWELFKFKIQETR